MDELLGRVAGTMSPQTRAKVEELLRSDAFRPAPGSDAAWVEFESKPEEDNSTQFSQRQADNVLHYKVAEIQALSSELNAQSGGQRYDDYNRVMDRVMALVPIPTVVYIDAFRQVRPADREGVRNYTGVGLVDQIATLQSPEALDQPTADAKYRAINEFLSTVLEEPAELTVPHSRSTINLRMRGDVVLPLEHQGTGLHQVVILAVTATTLEDTLVCIEEPELNLHPVMQRRLLRYLQENTSNQYIIATHSAQMLDYENATVFHLEHGESGTIVTPATTPAAVSNICLDLGYRPSDLLQSNAIIWVEGPSDRIYLKHWISVADSDLLEGLHFSIMFYGGSLLRELTFDDPAVSEFINLRRLNRHSGILIDSDRTSTRNRLGRTKSRVKNEFSESVENGFAWITDGYTIENYVPSTLLDAAVMKVHPRKAKPVSVDRWANPLKDIPSPDKPKIAREVVMGWRNPLSDPVLRKHVERVVGFIHRANFADKVRAM